MNQIATLAANDDSAIVEPNNWLNFLAHAVRDPSIQIDKLEALRRMQREDIAEDARVRFIRARSAAQSEMLPILRTHPNTATNSKYAPLDVIDPIIRPIYTRHGFGMDFDSEPIDGGVRVICEVTHDAGHVITRRLEGALDSAGPQGRANKTPIQALVSATTYLRRTLTCMVWNLAMFTDDNDGNRQRPSNDTGELNGQAAVDLLYQLIAETKTDERRLLVHLGFPDLTTIKDVPAREFAKFKNALLSKRNTLAQRAANSQTSNGAAA